MVSGMGINDRETQTFNILANFHKGLLAKVGEAALVRVIVNKIQKWAGNEPFMTQLICDRIIENADIVAKTRNPDIVDRLIQEQIIQRWQESAAASHFLQIQNTLLAYEATDALLILYLQTLERGNIPAPNTPEQAHLLSSGLIRESHGRLKVTNPVYAQVFNKAWIEQQLPGLTRPVRVVPSVSNPETSRRAPFGRKASDVKAPDVKARDVKAPDVKASAGNSPERKAANPVPSKLPTSNPVASNPAASNLAASGRSVPEGIAADFKASESTPTEHPASAVEGNGRNASASAASGRVAAGRVAAERIAAERNAEAERIAAERNAEADRIAAERIVAERIAAERITAERIAASKRIAAQDDTSSPEASESNPLTPARSHSNLANNAVPEVAVSEVTVSEVDVAEVDVAEVDVAEVEIPEMAVPEVAAFGNPEPTTAGSVLTRSLNSFRFAKPTALLLGSLAFLILAGSMFSNIAGRNAEPQARNASSANSADAATGAKDATAPIPQSAMGSLMLLGDTFSGYSTFRDADFQAALQESGITLEYADEFDQARRAKKLSKGQADIMVTTLDQFLLQQPKGKIVGLLDRTLGADAVVLNTKQYKSLNSLLDLKTLVEQSRKSGKKLSIAYASGTPSEYLALVLDTRFDNFNLSDFELKPVADASAAWELMQNPKENVAIAVLWEPFVTQAREKGYSVVLSSKDTPNAILDVIVASDRLIAKKPDLIAHFLEKYYRRIDANVRDGIQLQTQVAKDGDLSVAEAATIINGIDFFTATESKNWFSDGTLKQRVESTAAILTLSERLAKVPNNADQLYDSKFVTEAANNTQALIDLIRSDNPEVADKLSGKRPTVTAATQVPTSAAIQTAPDIGNAQVRGEVSFNTSSADLTAEGQQALDLLASELKEFNEATVAVRILGHTSRTGDAEANLLLSQQRAQVVTNYLQEQGGVNLNILPEGKGFSEPLPGLDPADGQNQRTEIRLVRVN
jgi:OmpA-OmpF porin, OOP family